MSFYAALHRADLPPAPAHPPNVRLVASGGDPGTVRLWDATSGALLRVLRGERRYEALDITGLTGITETQRGTLIALGAVERDTPASPPA